MDGLTPAVERRVPVALIAPLLAFVVFAHAVFLGLTGLPVTMLIAGAVAFRFRSTRSTTSKPRVLLSWISGGLCCSSIGWVLWFSSQWFQDDLPLRILFFWIVFPQLLWFGLRYFLDRGIPKTSQKIRLHTIQNKLLLVVCLFAAVAVITESPHRLRVAVETRFLEETAKSIRRKCALHSAPVPSFADHKLRTWTCNEDEVSFEAGTWSRMFDRGGTWGFTKSVLSPTPQFGAFEVVKPLGNNWWVWKQVTWRD